MLEECFHVIKHFYPLDKELCAENSVRHFLLPFMLLRNLRTLRRRRTKMKVNFPLLRGGRRISSSAFLGRRRFGYYLPMQAMVPYLQPSGQAMVDWNRCVRRQLISSDNSYQATTHINLKKRQLISSDNSYQSKLI